MKTALKNSVIKLVRAICAARRAFVWELRHGDAPKKTATAELRELSEVLFHRVTNCSQDFFTVMDSDGRQLERDLYILPRVHNTVAVERCIQSYNAWRKELVSAMGAQAAELGTAHKEFAEASLRKVGELEETIRNLEVKCE